MQTGENNAALLRRIAAGDEAALDQLVRENMGLVRSVAARYAGRGIENEDLVQIGCIGMIKASRSFDFSFGTAFSTYAVPLICGEIRRCLRDDGPLKVSRSLRKLGADAMRLREAFAEKNGREPRISELCQALGADPEEVCAALEAACPVRSLYESAGQDGQGQLLDFLPDESDSESAIAERLSLRKAIESLDDFEKQLIFLRYFKDLSQQQTGKILGISQVKVSRREKKIIERLRKLL